MAGNEGTSKPRDDGEEDQMKRKELVLKAEMLAKSWELARESKKYLEDGCIEQRKKQQGLERRRS